MRVVTTGSRNYTPNPADAWALRVALETVGATMLIHGGCRGWDQYAARVAERLMIPTACYPYPSSLGRAGGPARNRWMLEDGDALIAMVRGAGSGTQGCIGQASIEGVPIVALIGSRGLELAGAFEKAPHVHPDRSGDS